MRQPPSSRQARAARQAALLGLVVAGCSETLSPAHRQRAVATPPPPIPLLRVDSLTLPARVARDAPLEVAVHTECRLASVNVTTTPLDRQPRYYLWVYARTDPAPPPAQSDSLPPRCWLPRIRLGPDPGIDSTTVAVEVIVQQPGGATRRYRVLLDPARGAVGDSAAVDSAGVGGTPVDTVPGRRRAPATDSGAARRRPPG